MYPSANRVSICCRLFDAKPFPDNKVHWANMGPTRVLSASGGPHVGPINLAIRVATKPVVVFMKHSCHISGMVGPIDVNQKGSASVKYWVNCVTFILDPTDDLDFEFFKVKFRNRSISGIVGLADVKRRGNESDTGPIVLPCPLTTPTTLTLKFQGQNLK